MKSLTLQQVEDNFKSDLEEFLKNKGVTVEYSNADAQLCWVVAEKKNPRTNEIISPRTVFLM